MFNNRSVLTHIIEEIDLNLSHKLYMQNKDNFCHINDEGNKNNLIAEESRLDYQNEYEGLNCLG